MGSKILLRLQRYDYSAMSRFETCCCIECMQDTFRRSHLAKVINLSNLRDWLVLYHGFGYVDDGEPLVVSSG